jgi:hypothetical protein
MAIVTCSRSHTRPCVITRAVKGSVAAQVKAGVLLAGSLYRFMVAFRDS